MQDSLLCCGRLPPCLGLIWLYAFILPGTPVGPQWFSSHYQCPTHVRLPLTLLVAHWPQQGTKHTNPLWSQNGSWTIAWHLQHSHEVAQSMSYSSLGINGEDNVQYLFCSECIHLMILFNNLIGTTLRSAGTLNIHVKLIKVIHMPYPPYAIAKGVLLYKTVHMNASDTTYNG